MSAKEEFDPDILDTLTDEERAAIMSDDLTDEDRAAMADIAGEGAGEGDGEGDGEGAGEGDGEGDGEGAGEGDGEGDGAPPIEGQGADGTPTERSGAKAAAEEGAAEEEATDADPKGFTTPPAKEIEERLSAIKDERKALAERFRAGEIELDAFQAASDALSDEQAELSMRRASGAAIEEINRQTAEQRWNKALGNLVRTARLPEGGGVDYEKDQEKAQDLDGFIKMLAAKPENGQHGFDWFLAEAHKRVLSLHGLRSEPPKKNPPPKRAAPTPQPSLATVPGGEGPGDLNDSAEFSHLDKLDGLAFEEALARLTPAQRSRYAAAA